MSESIGSQLQAARVAQGLEIEDVAHKTRIHHDVLRKLEADAFDELPNKMFVKSFLKLYGDHVGVDATPAFSQLEAAAAGNGEQFLLGGINPAVRDSYGHLSRSIPVRPILASVAAVITLAFGGNYLVSHLYGGDAGTVKSAEPEPAPAVPETPETADLPSTKLVSAPETQLVRQTFPLVPIDTTIPEKKPIDPDLIPKGTPVIRKAEPVASDEGDESEAPEEVDSADTSASAVSDEPSVVPDFATREETEEE